MTSVLRRPKPPIVLANVVDDGEAIRDMAKANGPYWQPGRMLTTSGAPKDASDAASDLEVDENLVGPVFRGDWAFGEPLVDGVEPLLHHGGFIDAAAQMYGTDVVVPEQVYVNLTTPLPRTGFSHTDIPEFRGLDRRNCPAWLLTAMGVSRLFEAERIHIVTAVAWFYRGESGGLRYWPDGMDGPSEVQTDTWNTAVVGDNDFMPHEVQRVGPRGVTAPGGMSIRSELEWDGDHWNIVDDGKVLYAYDDDETRLSLSWKAKVYADEQERGWADSGTDGVTIDEALARIEADLAESADPESLVGDGVDSADLRNQLSRRYTAYATSVAPARSVDSSDQRM